MDRGTCSYKNLNERYLSSLSPTENKKHCFDQSEYERRIRVLVSSAKRQSDRSMIKCSSFRNGVTQLSRLSGQEYPGLIILTLVAIDGLMPTLREEKKFRLLINNSLVLYQSLMVEKITVSGVTSLEKTIKDYLIMFKNNHWTTTNNEIKSWSQTNKISFTSSYGFFHLRVWVSIELL